MMALGAKTGSYFLGITCLDVLKRATPARVRLNGLVIIGYSSCTE